jgi:glycerophosphoryl diester phosphodiesterase
MPKLPLIVPPGFRIIAHRGASAYAPENTLAAFELAHRMGATEVELDVQFSRDRQIVVCHDRVLTRFGYPDVAISELTLNELLELDMGSWFSPYLYRGERILSFDSLLARFGAEFIYHVEIKVPAEGLVLAVLDLVRAKELSARVFLTSFHIESLLESKKLAPEQAISWLLGEDRFNGDAIERATAAGCLQICPHARDASPAMVAAAHAKLAEVRAHSVKNIDDMRRVIDAGCDGMTTNWPDWLRHEEPRRTI